MDRAFWFAAAAFLLPTFPLGYFWHLKVFRTRYERLETYRPDMIIPFGFAAMLIQALLYAWLYPRLFSTDPSAWRVNAVHFGALFGFLAWSLAVLPVAAKYRMRSVSGFMALETAFTVVHYAIVSPLIALAWRGAT